MCTGVPLKYMAPVCDLAVNLEELPNTAEGTTAFLAR